MNKALKLPVIFGLFVVLVATAPGDLQAEPASLTASAGAGMAQRAGGVFSTLDLGIDGRAGDFSGGVRLPVQFRVLDLNNDDQRGAGGTGLRHQDWDERSEWLRFLRHATWNWSDRAGNRALIRVAPLAGVTLGHGAIVSRYHGLLRPDRYKAGARVKFDAASWGGDFFTDDVTRARLIAGRVFLRPFADSRRNIARTFTIGATAAVDRQAPFSANLDAGGDRTYDDTGLLNATRSINTVAGIDVGVELVRDPAFSIVPYGDATYSHIASAAGMGANAGLRLHVWPGRRDRSFTARWEIRAFDGTALPGYFDTMYEVEQARWLGTGPLRTKAETLRARDGGTVTGHMFALSGRFRAARMATTIELYDADNLDTFAAWIELPYADMVRLRAMVTKRRFTGLGDTLSAGEWTAAATAQAEILPPFSAYLEVQRAWHVTPGRNGLETTWDGAFGLMLSRRL